MPEPIVPSSADSIEVPPNPDNGNVPVDAPDGNGAPLPPDGSNPTPPTSDGQPSTPSTELYELPDGRKVDAATLSKEWKENFLPDYTRKSQALAGNPPPQQGTDPNLNTPPNTNPVADPNWQPKTYAEIVEAAKASMIADMEARENARNAERKAVEDAVSAQITELKTTDPNLNENALFQHALKYGFRDLKAAYQNMSDMSKLVKDVKTTTANDIRRRGDPVAGNPSATGTQINPSSFATSVEYLRAIQGKV